MTDAQLIRRLKNLVRSMHEHIDNGCADYDMAFGRGCDECRYARHTRYSCARVEDLERRMDELGVKRGKEA